ncbi:MAG: hypothetical protein KGZ62_10805 [Sulfurimonas sp.]|nr:hypothetical protein [Sulfurimonas sp.]
MGGDIQKIEDNHGQIAQNVSGDQIYNQTNNYFSFTNTSNIITITVAGEKIKEDYINHYMLFEDELDGAFDDIQKRYTNQLLCNLIDIKSEIHDYTKIVIQTQTLLELNEKLKKSNDVNSKISISKEIENEKIKCKEIGLFFKLIFEDIVELDVVLIIEVIYLLLTTDVHDSWVENEVVLKFYESLEIKKDTSSRNEIIELINSFLYESENILIPSSCGFVFYDNSFWVLVKYPMNRKVGSLSTLEKKEMEAEFYNEVIHQIILKKIDFNHEYFCINNYSATLYFTDVEHEIRSIIPEYIIDDNSEVLGRFKGFEFDSSVCKNPIPIKKKNYLSMQRVISFIVAKDKNNQDILINVMVGNNFEIENLNIGGYVLPQEEIFALSNKIKIEEELLILLSDNEPLNITYKFINIYSKTTIIQGRKFFEKLLSNLDIQDLIRKTRGYVSSNLNIIADSWE